MILPYEILQMVGNTGGPILYHIFRILCVVWKIPPIKNLDFWIAAEYEDGTKGFYNKISIACFTINITSTDHHPHYFYSNSHHCNHHHHNRHCHHHHRRHH